ncbi:hypothetical protein AcetOrient_orf01758 [Acetobacter orientalis]|uniref:Uncharacterized protein n=1 Tax=Acetobacter orientalis TaxID=146474 RepID=A0A2Z5ZH85_9PROT|nr:hypothetical protein AcetOrient_orf01758 [Acetobacter orientalis]
MRACACLCQWFAGVRALKIKVLNWKKANFAFGSGGAKRFSP